MGGDKYFTLQVNERSVYGKKAVCCQLSWFLESTAYNACPQADGLIVVKTKQAILVAIYVAPIQAAEATPVVENLADYLISVGY